MRMRDLTVGTVGADVGNLQRFLNQRGYRDQDGNPLKPDEQFGKKTAYAVKEWSEDNAALHPFLVRNVTVVTPRDLAEVAVPQGYIPFVQAKNFTKIFPQTRTIERIVIHTTEALESNLKTAENVAAYFADQPRQGDIDVRWKKDGTPWTLGASAHYSVDADSTIQCVRDMDVAWHAPGVNHNGIGIELAGTAMQTSEEWHDAMSTRILERAAKLVGRLAWTYDIEIVKLHFSNLKGPARGLLGHYDATQAFPGPGRSHWDPGPNFPWALFIGMAFDAFREYGSRQ